MPIEAMLRMAAAAEGPGFGAGAIG
jgi:hypothetical protein